MFLLVHGVHFNENTDGPVHPVDVYSMKVGWNLQEITEIREQQEPTLFHSLRFAKDVFKEKRKGTNVK